MGTNVNSSVNIDTVAPHLSSQACVGLARKQDYWNSYYIIRYIILLREKVNCYNKMLQKYLEN